MNKLLKMFLLCYLGAGLLSANLIFIWLLLVRFDVMIIIVESSVLYCLIYVIKQYYDIIKNLIKERKKNGKFKF